MSAAGTGCGPRDAPAAGQQIVFFPSPVSLSADGKSAVLTVQGRIFEPTARGTIRRDLIEEIARVAGLKDDEKAARLFQQRASYFLSDSDGGERVSISVGDRTFPLPVSDKAGYFTQQIPLARDDAITLAKDGVISFQSRPTGTNAMIFEGQAVLVPAEGVSVVTDMDDTIKDTHVLDRKEMLKNTFVRPFKAVAGMPELYRSWKETFGDRLQFHVVSAGPWQLNEPLRQFTQEVGFPPFTWQMRSMDINAANLQELTAEPYAFKVAAIEELMRLFPKRYLVCVGDSGEQDPEVYAKILSEFPDRVDAVFIHDVGGPNHDYVKLFAGAAATKLRLFRDPKELPALDTLVHVPTHTRAQPSVPAQRYSAADLGGIGTRFSAYRHAQHATRAGHWWSVGGLVRRHLQRELRPPTLPMAYSGGRRSPFSASRLR
jgi:phosphatidate phosphatase APP1